MSAEYKVTKGIYTRKYQAKNIWEVGGACVEKQRIQRNFAMCLNPPCEIFARGFFMVRSGQISHHEDPPCEISQGGFSPCEIWTLHLSPFENAFEIPYFETLLMIFHCRFSKIFCLIFSFVNTYFTLVINQ